MTRPQDTPSDLWDRMLAEGQDVFALSASMGDLLPQTDRERDLVGLAVAAGVFAALRLLGAES